MGRKAKTEHRERLKNAEPVEINGKLYRPKNRVTYTFSEDGCNVRTVHTALVACIRNPDGSRVSLTEVNVTASGSPDAVAAYFAVARGAVFTADGSAGSHLFTI